MIKALREVDEVSKEITQMKVRRQRLTKLILKDMDRKVNRAYKVIDRAAITGDEDE